mgnify:CR=1 FL=1
MIHIIYRTCEKINPTNGSRPNWCQEKEFKFKCLKSLAAGLIKDEYKFIVIGDSLSKETEEKIFSMIPDADIKNYQNPICTQKDFEYYNNVTNFMCW